MPFIVSWPEAVKPAISDALVCQIDFLQSFAALFNESVPANDDGENMMNAFLGNDKKGRSFLIEQAGTLAIVKDNWKYIKPGDGPAYYALTDTESGNAVSPQLYDLAEDKGEKNNLAEKHTGKVRELRDLLQQQEDRSN